MNSMEQQYSATITNSAVTLALLFSCVASKYFKAQYFLHRLLVSDIVNLCIKMLHLFSSDYFVIIDSELQTFVEQVSKAGQNLFVDCPLLRLYKSYFHCTYSLLTTSFKSLVPTSWVIIWTILFLINLIWECLAYEVFLIWFTLLLVKPIQNNLNRYPSVVLTSTLPSISV